MVKKLDIAFDEAPAVASSDALKRAVEMAELLKAETARLEAMKLELAEQQAKVTRLELEDIPTLLTELGLKEIELITGEKIKVNPEIQTSITKENAPQAIAWLIKNGFGGIVKTSVLVQFGKEEREIAVELAERLKEEYDDGVAFSEFVHPATLKSFVKERLEEGDKIPLKLFSVHQFKKAKLIPKKRR